MKKLFELANEEVFKDYFIPTNVELKTASNGKKFLSLSLINHDITIEAKKWDATEDDFNYISTAQVLKAEVKVNIYMEKPQLVILRYKPLKKEELDLSKVISVSKYELDDMLNEFEITISNCQNENLRNITLYLYNQYKEKLSYYGGAKTHHHNKVKGLAEHTYMMLKTAKSLVENVDIYSDVDTDLLYMGIIIHDLGKIDELQANEFGIINDYTFSGELLGHLVMGSENIIEACIKLNIDKFNKKVVMLRHMIISHHGIPEHGSNRYPMFKEAQLLHELDVMDCKITMFDNVTDQIENDTFSKRQWSLDNRKIYKA